MGDDPDDTRRRLLRLSSTAAIFGLAGCGGGNGGGGDTEAETTEPETTVAETTEPETTVAETTEPEATTEAGTSDEVPEEYETATSLGGTERNPDSLSSKEDVDYQEQPNEGNQCSGCTFYIEDKNGDGMGACAIVEGQIDPEGWCVSYAPYDE